MEPTTPPETATVSTDHLSAITPDSAKPTSSRYMVTPTDPSPQVITPELSSSHRSISPLHRYVTCFGEHDLGDVMDIDTSDVVDSRPLGPKALPSVNQISSPRGDGDFTLDPAYESLASTASPSNSSGSSKIPPRGSYSADSRRVRFALPTSTQQSSPEFFSRAESHRDHSPVEPEQPSASTVQNVEVEADPTDALDRKDIKAALVCVRATGRRHH